MPKPRSVYRCTECGHEHPKWVGRWEARAAGNSSAEGAAGTSVGRKGGKQPGRGLQSYRLTALPPTRLRDVAAQPLERWRTGLNEFDFVLGGGIVPGSMTLIGG